MKTSNLSISDILKRKPHAYATLYGSNEIPEIFGSVKFYQTNRGVIIYAEVTDLPKSDSKCESNVFGFHIHEGTECNGDEKNRFSKAMSHYNPDSCEHPFHAGDMPPLFENNGYALLIFLTNRFSVKEIIGKTIIVHSKPDDFTTQPSGNSGKKIACGIIQ